MGSEYEYRLMIGNDQSGTVFQGPRAYERARAAWETEWERMEQRPTHIQSKVRLEGRKITHWKQVA
jgi:hypothetical protein